MPYQRAIDPVEKHEACIERWGECPHWLASRSTATVEARVRGISHREFAGRDGDVESYLDALAELVDEDLAAIVDEQRAVVAIQQLDDSRFVRERVEAEAGGAARRRVVAAGNRRLDALETDES